MKKRALKLGVLLAVMALSNSETMNAQNGNNRSQPRERPTVEALFKQMDSNEDGKISEKEAKGPIKEDFAKIDVNKDGFLSKEEIEKAPKPERLPRN